MYQLTHTSNFVHLMFDQDMASISNAVLGGGIQVVTQALNLKVQHKPGILYPDPAETLNNFVQQQNWQGSALGMMTAASMESLATTHLEINGIKLTAWVTAGLGNALRAGDETHPTCTNKLPEPSADYQPGTINCWLVCSHPLTANAMAEALMLMTEARTLACLETGINSPISKLPITGTGTDASAFFCPAVTSDKHTQQWCGKHTQLGELIAQATYRACKQALQACCESA